MKGEKLNGSQDLVKRPEGGDGAASYPSTSSSLPSKLVTMLADDLERAHVELEFHLVSGRSCRVRLKAAVIDLQVADVLVTTLLERLGDPRAFLAGDGTIFTGRRVIRQSGLRDEHDGGENSDNCWGHFLRWHGPGGCSSPEAPFVKSVL
jgi:hypothetical protein